MRYSIITCTINGNSKNIFLIGHTNMSGIDLFCLTKPLLMWCTSQAAKLDCHMMSLNSPIRTDVLRDLWIVQQPAYRRLIKNQTAVADIISGKHLSSCLYSAECHYIYYTQESACLQVGGKTHILMP